MIARIRLRRRPGCRASPCRWPSSIAAPRTPRRPGPPPGRLLPLGGRPQAARLASPWSNTPSRAHDPELDSNACRTWPGPRSATGGSSSAAGAGPGRRGRPGLPGARPGPGPHPRRPAPRRRAGRGPDRGLEARRARATVRLTELFDRLVATATTRSATGPPASGPAAFYDRMGRALLGGVAELSGGWTCWPAGGWSTSPRSAAGGRRLAGRALRADRRDRPGGSSRWTARREAQPCRLPERLYLEAAAGAPTPSCVPCTRWLIYDAERARSSSSTPAADGSGPSTSATRRADTFRRDLAPSTASCWPGSCGMPSTPQAEQLGRRPRPRSRPRPQDATTGPPPRRIGEFELLSELGQGGMGVVYRAWQPSLGRQVALKCMLRSGDPKAEARFPREIRALGRVEHPTWSRSSPPGSRATSGSTRWSWSRGRPGRRLRQAARPQRHACRGGPGRPGRRR